MSQRDVKMCSQVKISIMEGVCQSLLFRAKIATVKPASVRELISMTSWTRLVLVPNIRLRMSTAEGQVTI